MAENKSTCPLLLISLDMEWLNAFQKGVERFYFFDGKQATSLDEVEKILKDFSPQLIVLSEHDSLPEMIKIKQLLHRLKLNIPTIVVAPVIHPNGGSDAYVKQGAEFVVARKDLLSAIRAVQHVMRQIENTAQLVQAEEYLAGVRERYDRLFLDLPDPICYLQDGLFMNANPAFMKTFKVKDKEALDELTIMNFVPIKSERNVKSLMKLALEKNVVPSEKIEFYDNDEEKLSMVVHVSHVRYRGEDAVQMYLRDSSSSGGGSGVDPTTGLASASVLRSSISQTQERSEENFLGTWIFLWLENYREVLQKDGYKTAEILIKSVADATERFLPPSTERVRFSDDALLLWIGGDKEQAIERMVKLIEYLDEIVPEDIGRLIHPRTYAGMQEIRKDSNYEELLSKSYRAVRGLSAGQSKERVAEPASADMSRKDERRVNMIGKLLDTHKFVFQYQPISALDPDGIPRYADRIMISADENDPDLQEEELEIDSLLQIADRYGISRRIDRVKFSQFCQDLLTSSGEQRSLIGFISLSSDSLSDAEFPDWVANQFNQTGIPPTQIVFDMRLDSANSAFTGMMHLVEKLRPLGCRFALSEIARFDDEIKEIISKLKPEVIKLDMREIDTFEDDEEQRFMNTIKAYTDENNVMLIAEHMESPAQLSRVWPYDIKFLQGDGMVPPMKDFNFNFNEPLF